MELSVSGRFPNVSLIDSFTYYKQSKVNLLKFSLQHLIVVKAINENPYQARFGILYVIVKFYHGIYVM